MGKRNQLIISVIISVFALTLYGCSEKNTTPKNAKYVFFFIADGMGFQHVTLTQAYLARLNDSIGNTNLSFTEFPVTGTSTTNSATRYITDSAAAGTALSTGSKTSVSTIGLNFNHSDTLYSVAYHAKKAGYRVGITTSVSVDHATPAAFYAHQPQRNSYYNIALDLIGSKFDFFAGGGFIDPIGAKSDVSTGSIFEIGAENGVFFSSSLSIPDSIKSKYSKIVYSDPNADHESSLKYYIDRDDKSISLADITSTSIELLENDNGFFIMVEGGKIDWASHDNDAATTIGEMICFSDAVSVALSFYKRYPTETLIVVTSDHETGGMSIGNNLLGYNDRIDLLSRQKISIENLSAQLSEMKQTDPSKFSFNLVQDFLKENLGLGAKGNELTGSQLEYLKKAYNASITPKNKALKKSEDIYVGYDPIAVAGIYLLNQNAGIGWTTHSHTGSQVPVYALGVGQYLFAGQMDNTDIPKRIAKIMGLSLD